MSDYLIQQKTMKGFANQIRRISNTTSTYTAAEILEILSRISGYVNTPNGSLTVSVVDYDGSILKTANLSKGQVLALPTPPNHEGLIFEGYSAPTSMIGGFVTANVTSMAIGTIYSTASGATEIYITTTSANQEVVIPTMINATSIDWGDGSIETENASSITTHTYTTAGNYIIKIYGATKITRKSYSPNNYITEVRMSNSIIELGDYTFDASSNLKRILFSKNIETMGYENFSACTSLESICLPINLQGFKHKNNNSYSYGCNFFDCTSLKQIILPKKLKELCRLMFYGCTSISNILLSDDLREIQERSICYKNNYNIHTNLNLNYTIKDNMRFLPSFNDLYFALIDCTEKISGEIVIPDGVVVVAPYAFYSRDQYNIQPNNTITKITLPESVKGISEYFCSNENSLTEVIMPSSMDVIGECAFQNCSSLFTTIPKGLKKVGSSAFKGTLVKEANFTEGLKELGNNVFSGCTDLESISVPSTVIYEEENHDSNSDYLCDGCTSLKKAELLGMGTNDYNYGYYEHAFRNCTSLTEVTLSDSFRLIDRGMFEGCSALPNMKFLENIKLREIAEEAFKGCSSLTELIIPNTVYSIGSGAFANCDGLTKFHLSNNIRISDNPIYGCNNITELTTDNSDYKVINGALVNTYYNNNILKIATNNTTEIPSDGSILRIGGDAFRGLTGLTSISIPANIISIEMDAFRESGFSEIEILANIETLRYDLFQDCKNLEKVTLPSSLTTIEGSVFQGCTSLKTLVIPDSVKKIGYYCFMDCTSLESIELPSSLTLLENETFSGCSSLKTLTIPDNVTTIETECFKNCTSLETLYIPTSVTTIELDVCLGCTSLTSVVYQGTEEQWASVNISKSSNNKNKELLDVLTFAGTT